jgi:transposase
MGNTFPLCGGGVDAVEGVFGNGRAPAVRCSAAGRRSDERGLSRVRHFAQDRLQDLRALRTGCPWRYLPRDSFPPRSTVYNIFRKFQRDGVWEAIWAELHMALRERMGREASPSAAVLDSQSVKSAEKGAAKTTMWVTTPARS